MSVTVCLRQLNRATQWVPLSFQIIIFLPCSVHSFFSETRSATQVTSVLHVIVLSCLSDVLLSLFCASMAYCYWQSLAKGRTLMLHNHVTSHHSLMWAGGCVGQVWGLTRGCTCRLQEIVHEQDIALPREM